MARKPYSAPAIPALTPADEAVAALKEANALLREAEQEHHKTISIAEKVGQDYREARRKDLDEAEARINRISGMRKVGPRNQKLLERARSSVERIPAGANEAYDDVFNPSVAQLNSFRAAREKALSRLMRLTEPD